MLTITGLVVIAVVAGATSQAHPRLETPATPAIVFLTRAQPIAEGLPISVTASGQTPAPAPSTRQGTPVERQANVAVELDIFSGRPNPRWLMRADQAPTLATLFASAPRVTPAEPPGLGYRGFILHTFTDTTAVPQTIRVYGGTITATIAGDQVTVADEHGLEQLLLADAQRMGHDPLIATRSR